MNSNVRCIPLVVFKSKACSQIVQMLSISYTRYLNRFLGTQQCSCYSVRVKAEVTKIMSLVIMIFLGWAAQCLM